VRAAHRDIRDRFKACALGVRYGVGTTTLARMIGESEPTARELLRQHRTAFPNFWRWSDAVESHGVAAGELQSVFGWRGTVGSNANPRFLRNFPMQANGAEMLRLACCLVTEAGISICAPLHDTLLIEAPLSELDEVIRATRRLVESLVQDFPFTAGFQQRY
jgi:DNA polymerase I